MNNDRKIVISCGNSRMSRNWQRTELMWSELVEKLREGLTLSAADIWERLAATVACKAAVKANTPVAEEGLLALAEKVLSGEIARCPHGRPVMTVFTRTELDKRFGRIV